MLTELIMTNIDQLRIMVCLIMTIVLSFFFPLLKNRNLRIFYSLSMGLLLQYIMYGIAMLNLTLCTIIVYAMVNFLPKKKIGIYVTVFTLVYLSILHLARMISDYGTWSMDVSTVFMMTISKFGAFAYSYSDNELEIKNLSERRKQYVINKINFLDYVTYIYFLPSCLIGPFFEYNDFIDFINQEKDYKNIPSSVKPSLLKLLQGILFGVVYFSLKKYGDVNYIMDEIDNSLTFPLISFFLIFIHKYKYYIGFCFSDSAMIASGISYEGKTTDKIPQFKKIQNLTIKEI